MASEGLLRLYRKPEIRLLLNWVLDRHNEIKPVHTSSVFAYPEVTEVTGLSDPVPLLDELSSFGVFERNQVDVEVACPDCGHGSLRDKYACPFCGADRLEKGEMVEHYACGHADFIENFTKNGDLVCPRCGITLKLIGTDYRRVPNIYRCENCKRTFSVPKIIHICNDCDCSCTYETAQLRPIYSYVFNEKFREEIAAQSTLETPLTLVFQDEGFQAERSKTLRGASGVEHNFDFVADRGSERFIFSINTDPEEVKPEKVIEFFAKLFDVDAKNPVMIVMPRLSEEARRIAEMYRINVVEGENVGDIIQNVRALIGGEQGSVRKVMTSVPVAPAKVEVAPPPEAEAWKGRREMEAQMLERPEKVKVAYEGRLISPEELLQERRTRMKSLLS